MIGIFDTFIKELINDVPQYIYEMLISLSLVGILIFFSIYGWRKALKYSLRLLFFEYIFLTYCNTVFCRSTNNDIWHDFTPFWSYKAYYSGENPSLLPEIIMNIAGFVPLGFLMAAAFQKLTWWQVILTGF